MPFNMQTKTQLGTLFLFVQHQVFLLSLMMRTLYISCFLFSDLLQQYPNTFDADRFPNELTIIYADDKNNDSFKLNIIFRIFNFSIEIRR